MASQWLPHLLGHRVVWTTPVGIFFDQDFTFPSMGWAAEMYDSIVPMEAAGDNIHSTSVSRPVDLRAPRLQGAELFIGAHVEGTVSSEVVEEREGAVDEGYEQQHQARDWEVSLAISSVSETNMSTVFEGVQQAIIAYLMEEEVLEVRRQEMRGRFREDLLVALGMLHKRKRDDGDDSSEE
ncbi:hypothetical protein I315_06897 [Cryptococcus gattii Ru294]|nr:hypothetical protein I315_06897 [Cryptococcus gattii Ru294]